MLPTLLGLPCLPIPLHSTALFSESGIRSEPYARPCYPHYLTHLTLFTPLLCLVTLPLFDPGRTTSPQNRHHHIPAPEQNRMVGVPGKYRGCETCRSRRVKCGTSMIIAANLVLQTKQGRVCHTAQATSDPFASGAPTVIVIAPTSARPSSSLRRSRMVGDVSFDIALLFIRPPSSLC